MTAPDPTTVLVRRAYPNGRTAPLHAVRRISGVDLGRAAEAVTYCGLTLRNVCVHGIEEARWPRCAACGREESLVCLCPTPTPGRYGHGCGTCHRLRLDKVDPAILTHSEVSA